MSKLRVQWTPDINQDIDAITSKNSPFYDEEFTNDIIKKYGSIDNFRKELNQNKDVSVRKIVRCEDPMVCLRGCSVHEQTCKHPIYGR